MCSFNNIETESANIVIFGYSCQERINHDDIHIINELIRNQ